MSSGFGGITASSSPTTCSLALLTPFSAQKDIPRLLFLTLASLSTPIPEPGLLRGWAREVHLEPTKLKVREDGPASGLPAAPGPAGFGFPVFMTRATILSAAALAVLSSRATAFAPSRIAGLRRGRAMVSSTRAMGLRALAGEDPLRVYLVRHGAVDLTTPGMTFPKDCFYGGHDVPLSTLGKEEAQVCAPCPRAGVHTEGRDEPGSQ